MAPDPRIRPMIRASVLMACGLFLGCDGPPPLVNPSGSLKGHANEVVALAFSPEGKTLASRSSESVKLWDVAGRRETRSFPSDGASFSALAFSPDGRTIAENRAGFGAVARDVASGNERASYRQSEQPVAMSCYSVSYGWGLSYSPDGKTLAGGASHQGEDGFVAAWDVESGQARAFGTFGSPVTTVAHSPDGRTIAAGSASGQVDLFDSASQQQRLQLPASRSFLTPVSFSPDGRTLATASDDRKIRLWDVETGQEKGKLKYHLKGVLGVAFHPGGRLLASGDAGGLIFLWDLNTLRPIARLEGHRGKVWAVAFSPDRTWLASAGEDREVRLWDVSAIVLRLGR